MKYDIVVYGLGKYFEDICEKGKRLEKFYNIVGYCDKNVDYADIYEKYISPFELKNIKCDFIIITSIHYKEIINDLLNKYEVCSEKIKIWEEDLRRKDYNASGAIFAFGQFGEDYVISSLLKEKGISFKDASYIEVGVDNPYLANNTYFLHLAGANGILVDANPESINLIKVVRKGQKVINSVISNQRGITPFYISNIPSLSSMDSNNIKLNNGEIKEKIYLRSISINDILAMQEKTIVLSIDLEGYDESAVRDIDFNQFRPEIICAEVGKPDKKLLEYMESNGYSCFFCNYVNSIWKKK